MSIFTRAAFWNHEIDRTDPRDYPIDASFRLGQANPVEYMCVEPEPDQKNNLKHSHDHVSS